MPLIGIWDLASFIQAWCILVIDVFTESPMHSAEDFPKNYSNLNFMRVLQNFLWRTLVPHHLEFVVFVPTWSSYLQSQLALTFSNDLGISLSFPPSLPTALKKFLLYARKSEIRGVDVDDPYLNIITALTVPDIDDVTAVDYDAADERIYWADVKTQTIKRAFINGTALETIVSGGIAPTLLLCIWLLLCNSASVGPHLWAARCPITPAVFPAAGMPAVCVFWSFKKPME